ncbi:MAG TPA: peroxiredoxin [Gammaproteobacteria bacterium]|nr:peroxiredoxin [Gammaproteobacteria bacterium]
MLVCRKAPDFKAHAVLANGSINDQYRLSDEIRGKYGLVFFYPLDFTFVCPTELIALDNRIEEFKNRNVEVIAVSVDSAYTHQAWRNTPINKGGIGPVKYTLVADLKHEISQAYGVEHPEAGLSLRGTFLIDKQGIVRSQIVNDAPIGRSIDEIIRLIDAVQFHETHGEVCPAGWEKGRKALKASAEGVAAYLTENAEEL